MKFFAYLLIIIASFVGTALGICGKGCPPIKDYICGENAVGKKMTFDSSCDLVQYNCKYPKGMLRVVIV
jgi:hypothetical protein